MELIENIPITDSVFGSSNATESAAEWDIGTSYALNDIVQVAAAKRKYQSLVGSNVGNDPTAVGSTSWVDIGPVNQWAMYDEYNETQTERAENITSTLNPGGRVTAIALYNLDAASIQIVVTDPIEGEVYNQTFSLNSYDNIADYYDYFFAPLIRKTDLLVSNLPPYASATITIIANYPDGTAKIGKVVIGTLVYIGATLYGAEFGRIDATRITEDDFGNLTIVRRSSRRRMSLSVVVDAEDVDEVGRILDDRRGIPTTFVGQQDYIQTYVDGIPREWRVAIDHEQTSNLTIDVEGLR